MARTLSEIYQQAKLTRNQYLGLTEYNGENSSKMSVMDAITWTTAACIWAFENIMDVFKVDLAKDLQNRVNGTPRYFASALLRYQKGDELIVSGDGTSVTYANIDPEKRIITRVAYAETDEEVLVTTEGGEEKLMGFNDKRLVLKVATGQPGAYEKIPEEEMLHIRSYLNKLLFAGQRADVTSYKGDVLVPRVTVYHDGTASESSILDEICDNLDKFVASIEFDGVIYAQKVIDCIQAASHVTDVQIDPKTDHQGVFVAQYNDDDTLKTFNNNSLLRIDQLRYIIPNSGYIRESSREGVESSIPKWRESIVMKLEDTPRQSNVI